ncbi:MAG: hypothetical protein Q9217_004673 [Psora testacea]
MVYYFTSSVIEPPATVYVGKDKFENEELIKFGWDCDFHADNLSSAHIYLRLATTQQWDALPTELLEDCAQLTKAYSIEGNKKDNVTIIYTPWANLRKEGGMATGQVGFHDTRKVRLSPSYCSSKSLALRSSVSYSTPSCFQTRKILVSTRTNAIINRLEKTRTIRPADELPAAKDAYLKEQRREKRKEAEKLKKEENRVLMERRMEKEEKERAWEELQRGEGGRSNEEGFDEDDFM